MVQKSAQQKDSLSDKAESNDEEQSKLASMRLKRYCFLGSFESVKIHLPHAPKVAEVFGILNSYCELLDANGILSILRVAFKSQLFRQDEATLVFAVYLLGDAPLQAKTKVREEFVKLIKIDIQLFLFCKYATAVHKFLKRPVFCQTIKKAISAWYVEKSTQELTDMFRRNRGRNGFTHGALMKLCRIPDYVLGTKYIYDSYNKSCTTLIAESENPLPAPPMPPPAKIAKLEPTNKADTQPTVADTTAVPKTTAVVVPTPPQPPKPKECNAEEIRSQVLAISKLRTITDPDVAIKIIVDDKLCFEDLPYHLMEFPKILCKVIPTMSCQQLLSAFHAPQMRKHFAKQEVMKICRQKFQQTNALKDENVDPIMLLMNLDNLNIDDPIKPINNKQSNRGQIVKFSKNLLRLSFNDIMPLNQTVHITINMQNSYMKRKLQNTKMTAYKYAAIALAFTFYKAAEICDVFRWCESVDQLQPVEFKKNFQYADAFNETLKVNNSKNKQLLYLPIAQALKEKLTKKYDLFICIVPAATRGNKENSSKMLADCLATYRRVCANNAKFVIVDLCRYKKSMSYTKTSSEHILEICGIDSFTVGIIRNFALGHFD